MTRRFTSFMSVLVLALTMVFASLLFAAGMASAAPNRTIDGGSGPSPSGAVSCHQTFLTEEGSSVQSGHVAPPSIHGSAIILEQDTGAVFVLVTDLSGGANTSTAQAGMLADGMETGCLSPILPEDQPSSWKPR
jgi:hypothetical protein